MRSRGELTIDEILTSANIPFETEKKFADLKSDSGVLLRFDFCVYDDEGDVEALIEYQGEQHYMAKSALGGKRSFYRQQKNDDKKRRYCAAKNIKLIEIPYIEESLINYDYLYNKIYG